MEKISVYVVSGFLGSGKTSFINHLLSLPAWHNVNLLVLQYESGNTSLSCSQPYCYTQQFSVHTLEQQPSETAKQIESCILQKSIDEIWIEWNGMEPLAPLQALLAQPEMQKNCFLQKIIFLASAQTISQVLGRTGAALPEQLAEADLAVVSGKIVPAQYRHIRGLLRSGNPWLPVCRISSYHAFYREWFEHEEHVPDLTFAFAAAGVVLYLAARPVFQKYHWPFDTVINSFLGILLQALPFLLIGVLLSAAVQVLLPRSTLERWFAKSPGVGALAALAAGFCFPVCDCASVPFFKSLLQKGVPLSTAVVFLLAAPIVNPAAILSTYIAFGGNWRMAICRVCGGIVIAMLVSFSFAVHTPKCSVLQQQTLQPFLFTCGNPLPMQNSAFQKIAQLLNHAKYEFFSVGKFLIIGAFLSAVLQSTLSGRITAVSSLAGSILLLMAVAFCLSLCSSSDAVIARSMAGSFPNSALLAFLLFGPMLDIKNLLMLSAICKKRFLLRLGISTAGLCFVLTFLLGSLKGA